MTVTNGAQPRQEAPAETAETAQTLDLLCRHAVTLIEATSERPTTRIALRAGTASIDVRWPAVEPQGAAARIPADPAGAAGAADGLHHVLSPMVGTFYRASEPGLPPLVAEGDVVHPGQQIGILEAMKLMNPIEADRAGRVVVILVPDGASVEYGEPLFAIEPAALPSA